MIKKLTSFLLNLPLVKQLYLFASHKTLPGLHGITILAVAKQFRKSLISSRLSMRAAAVSYNFFMALFPTIIFLFTLTAYLPIEHFDKLLLDSLKDVLPPFSFMAVENTLLDIISIQRDGLLSFGFFVALFYATNGVSSIISSFNASVLIQDNRPEWKILLVSLQLTIIVTILLVLAISLMLFANFGLGYLIGKKIITYQFDNVILWVTKWVIFYGFIFFIIAFLYYLGPSKENRIKFFSLGAFASSFIILLLLIGFAFFVGNFGTYNTLYGSVGALIAVLVLINLNALVLLAGYEFNASIYHINKMQIKSRHGILN
jgi:membrane protein